MEVAVTANKDNDSPYIVCVGTVTDFKTAVGVYKKNIITAGTGQLVFSALITLMAVYFAYNLEFGSFTKQVLQLLQEQLLKHPLASKTRLSTAYMNMFRAITCIAQQNRNQSQETDDDTQLFDF